MTRMFDPTELSGARAGQRSQERRPDTADVYLLARQMQADALANTTHKAIAALGNLSARALRAAWRAVAAWRARRRTVAELSQLDDRALSDIGIDPHDIKGAVDRLIARQNAPREAASAESATPAGSDFGETLRQVDAGMAPRHSRARQDAQVVSETAANSDADARRKAA